MGTAAPFTLQNDFRRLINLTFFGSVEQSLTKSLIVSKEILSKSCQFERSKTSKVHSTPIFALLSVKID